MRGFSRVFMILTSILAVAVGAAAETIRWIPAAASNPGRHGTYWTTDLWIYSPVADSSSTVYLAFFPDGENAEQPAEVPVEISRLSTVKISDAVFTLFGEHLPGAIRLRSEYPFEARSRTVNSGGESGSYGEAIPAVAPEDASEGSIFPGAANVPGGSGVRTNIGILNLSDEETSVYVLVTAPDPSGTNYGEARFSIGPGGWWQGDLFELIGADDQVIDDALVVVISGKRTGHLAYLSRVDNASGDGAFISPITSQNVFVQTYSWDVEVTLNPGDEVVVDSLQLYVDDDLAAEVADPELFETFHLADVVGDFDLCFVASGQAPEGGGVFGYRLDVIGVDYPSSGASLAGSRWVVGSFEFEYCAHVFPLLPW